MKPSEVFNDYWIYARRKAGVYPASTIRSGKWLIFASVDEIDSTWAVIKQATIEGRLGGVSKVATARDNPTSKDPNTKVICVYTYDYEDTEDVFGIREVLYGLGFDKRLVYKSDRATREGRYGPKVGTYYK